MTRGMGKIKSEFDLKDSRLVVGAGRERESEGWRELENKEAFVRGSCDLWKLKRLKS